MHFLFNRQNHREDLRFSFDDLTNTLGAQIVAFGHTWSINDDTLMIGPGAINVLFEGFTDEAIEVYGVNADRGAQFICIATEQPSGYDAGGLGGDFNHGQPAHMIGRQAGFIKACARLNFRAVWALVPGAHVVAWYRRWCPRTVYLPIGFAPGMLHTSPPEPEFDYGMYGSILQGGRRWQMLERLHKATGASVHILGANGIVPVEQRDAEMQRCKVLLQLRPNDASELVSSSRVAASLHAGRCVVAEYHRLHEPYSQVVRFAPKDDFDSFVTACTIALVTWRAEYGAQLARFQALLSPENTMGPALAIAGVEPVTEAAATAAATNDGRMLIATAVWGGDVDEWLRVTRPALQAAVARQSPAPRLRIYTTDADVARLLADPGIQALGEICDVELKGARAEIFALGRAPALQALLHQADADAARDGETIVYLPADDLRELAA